MQLVPAHRKYSLACRLQKASLLSQQHRLADAVRLLSHSHEMPLVPANLRWGFCPCLNQDHFHRQESPVLNLRMCDTLNVLFKEFRLVPRTPGFHAEWTMCKISAGTRL